MPIDVNSSKLATRWKNIRDSTNRKRKGLTKSPISNNLLFLLPYLKGKIRNSQAGSIEGALVNFSNLEESSTASEPGPSQQVEILLQSDPDVDLNEPTDCLSQEVQQSSVETPALEPVFPAWVARAKTQDQLARNLLLKKKIDYARAEKQAEMDFIQGIKVINTSFPKERKSKAQGSVANEVLCTLGEKLLNVDPHARMLVEDMFTGLDPETRRLALERLVELADQFKVKD